jgi:hypothetical protein
MPKTVAEMIAEASAEIESISPQAAAEEAAAGKAVLLDVREPVEWEHHIAGSVQVPGACSSSPPTLRARATRWSSTPPTASSCIAAPAPAQLSHAPP